MTESTPSQASEPVPPVVVGPGRASQIRMSRAFQGVAGRTAAVTGTLLLVGTIFDHLVVWGLQRQASPEWEFTALVNTVEALPRYVLAVALLYLARTLRGSTSLLGYRALALLVIAVGLAGAAAAGLAATDYFILKRSVSAAGLAVFRSTALKTVGMGALHALLLVPLGAAGLRRP